MEIRSLLGSIRSCYCREAVKHYKMPALTHGEHVADS